MEFGSYEVLERIAIGSTATVYKARHRELGQLAAIKELVDQLRESPRALQRFRAEAHILAGFDNPHIVTVYDFVEEPGRFWIAEEWVDGISIDALLAHAGSLAPEQCLGVLRGALLGLAYAHGRGVVHGDVAPNNIIADRAGTSKLVDFGVSAPIGSAEVYGTPAFMSPEAVRGAPLNPAGDVYSAGAVLYLLLAGRPVFPANTIGEVLGDHLNTPPPALSGHGRGLAALVADSLAKDPQARPRDAAEFLRRLEEGATENYGAGWLERASIAGPVLAALGGAAGTGAGIGMASGGSSAAPAPVGAPVLAQSPITTGAAVAARRNFWRSPGGLVSGGVLVAGVAAAVVLVAATGSGGDPGHSPEAAPPLVPSSGPVIADPVSSAPPSVRPVDSLSSSGTYKVETRVLSSNYEGLEVGDHNTGTFRIDLSCTATACRGTADAGSGFQYKLGFDGTTLTGTSSFPEVMPCVFTSGPKKGKPDPSTRFRRVGTSTFRVTVTSRSSGPAPAAGTVLKMTGFATNRTPKGEVIKGECTNVDRARHARQQVTLTYVPD